MKRRLCTPCMVEMKNAGKHEITRIHGGVNEKIDCWKCKCRRYGAVYDVTRKLKLLEGKESRSNTVRSEVEGC